MRGGAREPVSYQRCPQSSQSTTRQWFGCTYEWETAVRAPADLRLVHVDEYPWVAERAASAVAGHNAVMGPADGLLVDQIDGGIGARLVLVSVNCSSLLLPASTLNAAVCSKSWPRRLNSASLHKCYGNLHTWSSMIVCSNRGPCMATALGCWLVLHVPL